MEERLSLFKEYYYIEVWSNDIHVVKDVERNTVQDQARYSFGNYFRNRADAERLANDIRDLIGRKAATIPICNETD